MFQGCNDINEITFNSVETKDISDTISMFEGCTDLRKINLNINIENINNASKMFQKCSSLENITIEKFNTDKSKDMSYMFEGCSNIKDNNFLEKLSTSNVENMKEMFSGCSKITSLNLSRFDTRNVIDMSGMFNGMSELKVIQINNFNTKNVVNMEGMFESCSSLKELDLSSFNIEKVEKIENIFTNCNNLESLDLSSFDLEKTHANITKEIFKNTTDLLMYCLNNSQIGKIFEIVEKPQTIRLLIEKDKNSEINGNPEETIQIFGDSFNEFNKRDSIIFIDGKKNSNFDNKINVSLTNPVTVVIKFSNSLKTLKNMFLGCKNIKEVLLKDIEIHSVNETISMFENCANLNSIKFDNVSIEVNNSTSKMFQGCSSLNNIEIEHFSTDNVTDMSKMFKGCSNLSDVTFIKSLLTKNVKNMNEMFSGCSQIDNLDLTNFNTSNVKNMSGMFKDMIILDILEINNLQTEKVEDMSEMFQNCSFIESLDLSHFNTTMVKKMDKMFCSCSSLEKVNLTSFSLTNCNNTMNMFANTTRKLIYSIIENKEITKKAGGSWSEENDSSDINIKPLDIMFLVDKNSLDNSYNTKVKENIVYSAVNIFNKEEEFDNYNLSYGALFYNDSESNMCDFVKNVLNFTNFVYDINITSVLREVPENWEDAFNLIDNLSWRNESSKFIVHISNGIAKDYDNNTLKGNETDKIITYLAKNNFSIAGFYYNMSTQKHSFERAQQTFNKNNNYNYIFKYFDIQEKNKSYFPNLVIESIQELLNNSKNR